MAEDRDELNDRERPDPRRRPVSFQSDGPEASETDHRQFELDKLEVERGNRIQEENWIRAYWRPGMGWLYMLVCFMDFVFFPLLSMFVPAILRNFGVPDVAYVPWVSLTLSNGGMIHLAFGAILGVTAWTRGLEKIRRN